MLQSPNLIYVTEKMINGAFSKARSLNGNQFLCMEQINYMKSKVECFQDFIYHTDL
jgi:hypothetical protein